MMPKECCTAAGNLAELAHEDTRTHGPHSNIELEEEDVAVLYDILLAFRPQ
jgi:hypothetical protein